jgi:uridine kinase
MEYQPKYIKYKSKYQKLLTKLNNKMNQLKQSIKEQNPNNDNDAEPDTQDTLLDLIQNLLENNPVVYLFITGKYASGKSTTTSQIKDKFKDSGVFSIELDEIIREHVQDKTSPDQATASLNAFKVYKGIGSPQDLENFVQGTRSRIESGFSQGNKLFIIEGALSSKDICKQIIGTNPLLIIYFQPINPIIHKKRIVSRIKTDIIDNTYTLPGYWGSKGIFNRDEIKSDIESEIDIEVKYSDILDSIVGNAITEAETRAEQIQANFTTDNWLVIVKHT